WPAFVGAAKFDGSKVTIRNVSSDALYGVFLQRAADAMTSYVVSEVPAMERRLGPGSIRAFMYADYGIGTIGQSVIANTATIQDNPDLVRRFLKATYRGVKAAMEDPAKAIAALKKARPDADEALMLSQLKLAQEKLYVSERTRQKPLGWMAE